MKPEKREERQNRLLEAAAEVFSEKGYEAATIADVARRANMGKGTVYGYFKSKDDLFLDLFRWYNSKMENNIRPEAGALGRSARARLLALGDAVMDTVFSMMEGYTLSLEFWAATASSSYRKEFREAFRAAYGKFRSLVTDILRSGIALGEFRADTAVENLAVGIVAVWDATGIQFWVDKKVNPKKAARSSLEAILNGITVNRQGMTAEKQ